MKTQDITHDKVNKLLKGRCERSCPHYRFKTETCWNKCQTAREYIEHFWKIKLLKKEW